MALVSLPALVFVVMAFLGGPLEGLAALVLAASAFGATWAKLRHLGPAFLAAGLALLFVHAARDALVGASLLALLAASGLLRRAWPWAFGALGWLSPWLPLDPLGSLGPAVPLAAGVVLLVHAAADTGSAAGTRAALAMAAAIGLLPAVVLEPVGFVAALAAAAVAILALRARRRTAVADRFEPHAKVVAVAAPGALFLLAGLSRMPVLTERQVLAVAWGSIGLAALVAAGARGVVAQLRARTGAAADLVGLAAAAVLLPAVRFAAGDLQVALVLGAAVWPTLAPSVALGIHRGVVGSERVVWHLAAWLAAAALAAGVRWLW